MDDTRSKPTNVTHDGNPHLIATIRDEIARGGPMSMARFMEIALYEPGLGYYQRARRGPGRGGDFLTAPETHPFFGFTIARQVVDCWGRLGRPVPFVVREYGPGIGVLAYDVLAWIETNAPDLFAAMDYRLVEMNPHRLDEAIAAMAETGLSDRVAVEAPATAAGNPIVGIAIANEVVDAFPVHQLVMRDGELVEQAVDWDEETGWFRRVPMPISAAVRESGVIPAMAAHGVDSSMLPDDATIEVSPVAARWIGEVATGIASGFALVIDYGYPAAELYRDHRLGGLLRGYREHQVTDDPFRAIGEQDLTAHVDFSWLMDAAMSAGMAVVGLTTQAEFLIALGLGDLIVDMQADPATTIDDYYQAQAAVMRLIDPGGMGRFRVLGLAKGVASIMKGFARIGN